MLGGNGAGKSTLIKLLMGRLQPLSGQISLNSNSRCVAEVLHPLATNRLDENPERRVCSAVTLVLVVLENNPHLVLGWVDQAASIDVVQLASIHVQEV
jgi:ABC-type cobalamin/Fe3+-siderophores transport system ATPase subunit